MQQQPGRHQRALRVRDSDGHLWEQRHRIEDGEIFAVDAWTPKGRLAHPLAHPIHTWVELAAHYGSLTETNAHGWPQSAPV